MWMIKDGWVWCGGKRGMAEKSKKIIGNVAGNGGTENYKKWVSPFARHREHAVFVS
jgi:hypothetical protein